MTELERIGKELALSYEGDPWHGSPMKEILSRLDASTAAARPIPEAHTIWEITLHINAWMAEVVRRLRGAEPAIPEEGDWPAVTETSDEAWRAVLETLDATRAALYTEARRFPAERLEAVVGSARDAKLGTGVNYYQLLLGILQHDAYHSGQIALLRKALSREKLFR